MKLIFRTIIIILIVLYGCEDNSVQIEEQARINFQEGTIEGVKTEDDTTAVIQKLGRPDWISMGDFDGFSFCYKDKFLPGKEMIIVTFFNRIFGLNPPDYRVTVASVSNNYDGKSKEGIGVGTSHLEITFKLGNPTIISEYDEHYHFKGADEKINVTSFMYDEERKVKSIGVFTRTN